MSGPQSPAELEASLREIGAQRYHNLHPFHRMLHGGECSKGQVQAWALNRYYYQSMIPVKDASLIARCEGEARAAEKSYRKALALNLPAAVHALVQRHLAGIRQALESLRALRLVPGAQIVQVGERGGPTSMFLRGGNSNFTKVLVDGVPANDIGGGFDFS